MRFLGEVKTCRAGSSDVWLTKQSSRDFLSALLPCLEENRIDVRLIDMSRSPIKLLVVFILLLQVSIIGCHSRSIRSDYTSIANASSPQFRPSHLLVGTH